MASIRGAHDRRWRDWKLQEQLAERDIQHIDQQIATADLRIAVAERELANQDRQLANSQEVEAFLRSKLTNEGLYDWMAGQVSQVYFQSYKLAYDLAKRAERAYGFERGDHAGFIQFGYWDGLRKGLLAGERLALDLKRMETAHLEQNRREHEITKHVSLVLHDPLALIALKESGRCEIELPEALFDADYPGHYMRRLKHVSISVPCVVGPYTSVNATLTLLASEIRAEASAQGDYARATDGDDPRFLIDFAAVQSIATSHAQNDSGLFELSFRDERYLPFEGAGAVSRWRLEMPKETNAFDRSTVSDAVLHLRYTARDGGEALRAKALAARNEALADLDGRPQMRLFSVKHQFPDAWHQFLHPQPGAAPRCVLPLSRERFPYLFRGQELSIFHADLFLRWKDIDPSGGTETFAQIGRSAVLAATLAPPEAGEVELTLRSDGLTGDLLQAAADIAVQVRAPFEWSFALDSASVAGLDEALLLPQGGIRPDALDDLMILLRYTVG